MAPVLGAGPVVFLDGDYFGRTVNVASRITDYARPGEVLVSSSVVGSVGEVEGVAFRPIGPVILKGVSDPIDLYVAQASDVTPPSARSDTRTCDPRT